jgi:hypothetical protein
MHQRPAFAESAVVGVRGVLGGETTPTPNAPACFIKETNGRFVGGLAECGGRKP